MVAEVWICLIISVVSLVRCMMMNSSIFQVSSIQGASWKNKCSLFLFSVVYSFFHVDEVGLCYNWRIAPFTIGISRY